MRCIFKSFLILVIVSSPLLSQEIKIISKHSDFAISEQGKIQKYILLRSDQDLVMKVKGPTFVNMKFRGLIPLDKKGAVAFTISYLRDGGFRSTNTFEVKQEPKKTNRKVDVITEGTLWVTEHRWIQIKVPMGEHIYQISSPLELPDGLIVKVYKSKKEEKALLAKEEIPEIPIEQIVRTDKEVKEKEVKEKVIIAEKADTTPQQVVVAEKKVDRPTETAKKGSEVRYFSCALRLNVLVPSSKVDSTYAMSLDLKYISPFLNNRLAFGAEGGYYPLSGRGKNTDPQIGVYDFSYNITNVPVFIGAEYLLPFGDIPIGIFVDGGMAVVFSYSTSKTFGGESYTEGVAYGYYVGSGTQISLGYGYIISELRFSTAYLKYDTVTDEGGIGNIGGTNLYIGYKLVF